MNFRISLLAIACSFVCTSAPALASQQSLTPEDLSGLTSAYRVGIGFLADDGEFGITECVKGKVSDQVINVPTSPFAKPQIIASSRDSEVKVVFVAQASNRRVLNLTSDGKMISFTNPNKYLVCGSQYVSKLEIGVKIGISRTFMVSMEDKDRFVTFLKSHLTDLRSILQLDFSKENFRFSGSGTGLSGIGQSKALFQKMNECFWSGKACGDFIDQAYRDAAELDNLYPADRVSKLVLLGPVDKPFDGGEAMSYGLKAYSK